MSDIQSVVVSSTPLFDSLDNNSGSLQTECLFGEKFRIEKEENGWAYGETVLDNYQGWLAMDDLAAISTPTHRVAMLRTVVTSEKDVKSETAVILPFNAYVKVVDEHQRLAEIVVGDQTAFVPSSHLVTIDHRVDDWVATAEKFIGVPYRWGGRDSTAIDCSALIQLALQSAGIPSPRNSGDQQRVLGMVLSESDDYLRGDIVFWTGHVGVLLDQHTLLHANAYHRQVIQEPLEDVVKRCLGVEGPVSCVKRLSA